MASRIYSLPETLGKSIVMLAGYFTLTTGGAISASGSTGAPFTISKVSGETGQYKISLGFSTTYPDRYQALYSILASINVGTHRVTFVSEDVDGTDPNIIVHVVTAAADAEADLDSGRIDFLMYLKRGET